MQSFINSKYRIPTIPQVLRAAWPAQNGGSGSARPSSSAQMISRSAMASSSSASIICRSFGASAFRSSARSSSMCWSMVIVVSMTDVRDDGGSRGGEGQLKVRICARQCRRAEEPILSQRSATKRRENWRGRTALNWLCPPGTIGRSEQTGFPLVWHPSLRLVREVLR